MISIAVGLALAAAVLHACWNILLKEEGDPLLLAARAVAVSAVFAAPLGLAAWLVLGRPGLALGAYPLAGASGLIEVLYFVGLSAAYRRGDISLVYPTARGGAAALAVVAGIVLLRESLHPAELVGVVVLVLGMWLVRSPLDSGPVMRLALLTAVCIAAYTTLDRIGVRLGPAWLYGWILWTITAVLLTGWVHIAAKLTRSEESPSIGRAAAIGVLMTVAYLLVLLALAVAPLTIVAPVRESAVVGVAAWGVWRLGEPGARVRLVGALIILAGITVVAVT
jgi:drug/metabolite transporter (DMT)-like permease